MYISTKLFKVDQGEDWLNWEKIILTGVIELNLGMTLSRNARQIPEKKAVIFGEKSYTYKQLNEKVNQIVNGLVARQIKRKVKKSLF